MSPHTSAAAGRTPTPQLSVSVRACLSVCLSICLGINQTEQTVCPSVCMSINLSVCLSVCLSAWLTSYLSMCQTEQKDIRRQCLEIEDLFTQTKSKSGNVAKSTYYIFLSSVISFHVRVNYYTCR